MYSHLVIDSSGNWFGPPIVRPMFPWSKIVHFLLFKTKNPLWLFIVFHGILHLCKISHTKKTLIKTRKSLKDIFSKPQRWNLFDSVFKLTQSFSPPSCRNRNKQMQVWGDRISWFIFKYCFKKVVNASSWANNLNKELLLFWIKKLKTKDEIMHAQLLN